MRHVSTFPRPIREIMTQWIPMQDGCRLAARIWLPADAEHDPVPAVLEYLPYRRRDGTTYRDSITQPWLAGHGYAAVRVDIRGTGDSDGIITDEYALPEQRDGVEVIEWLARQPWCSGNVGMWGISWGGINALQVAAMAPPALKAIIPMGFAHDRYGGDCHFMGGCLLEGNMSWGNTLFAGSSRPPDPAVVGPGWRGQWLARLESTQHPIAIWLAHQRRDDYWKPGSVCEDYSRIKAAVYAVSGWHDSYSRNVLPLIAGLRAPRKALIGPWAHSWPHIASPGPAIGFLQEALRWWDHWLKGIDTGVMDEPMLRVWMGEWTPPRRQVAQWPGRWVQEAAWPAAQRPAARFRLTDAGLRQTGAASASDVPVECPQTVGLAAGYQCSYGLGPDLSDDQRGDDSQSRCFDSEALREAAEILGEPAVELEVSSDKPQALLAVRLCDVAPDGASLRVSYGLLNLSHRDSDAEPSPLEPGRRYFVRVVLCGIAHRFAEGHRIRLAVSTAYWPIAWPSPQAATVILHCRASALLLPVRPADEAGDRSLPGFAEPEGAMPAAMIETRQRHGGRPSDRIETDEENGEVVLVRDRDRGAWRASDTDVDYDSAGELRFAVKPGDPLAARQEFTLTTTVGRDGWRTRTVAFSSLTATKSMFLLRAKLEAYDGAERIFGRSWNVAVERDNI